MNNNNKNNTSKHIDNILITLIITNSTLCSLHRTRDGEHWLLFGLSVNSALNAKTHNCRGAFPIACSEQRRSAVAWHRIMLHHVTLPLRVPPAPPAADGAGSSLNQYWY